MRITCNAGIIAGHATGDAEQRQRGKERYTIADFRAEILGRYDEESEVG